ncbi:hypothetical protein Vretimale_7895 [Volvox reticuliferus]|uniref:Uncharacterized protein n=1 Tax=Volvox reticuliferus TaxID=1737510 RepID=A0A8J4C4E0_9CHLO|nr:hypothetical protein Vretifemale_5025 [Volvox reticuliferus]GIM03117.1 hypothetical protein Vretimale_7895 [Volvox reticuliferus]
MATGSISSHWPATAADGQEFELRSKRMGRGSFGTPKLSRSDVASSPSLATPSLPQRKCRANWRAGVGSCRFDDGTSISVTTIPKGGNNVDDELRCGSGRPGSFSKGLLVIALEEENDRLRGVLETERCARQLAEAEAIKQAARASDYEHQVKKLSSQLAEAQQKLADLEQAAFSRALVQAWLETAIPRRCASADQGPESSTACSAILEEPKPHIDSSVDVVEAANFANCPPALSSDDYHHDREGSASLVAVRGATVGKQPDMYLHGTFGLDISSGAELDFRDWDGAVIVRRSGCAISPNAHASSGPSPPVSSRSPDRPSQAFGPVPAPGHAGCQAVPCAKSPPRDCILLPAGELQGARTPEGDKCSANLAPAWSLPLQGEKHWPPLQPLLPPPPRADNPNDPVAQTPGRGHQMPPGGHTSPFVASAVSAHTLTAASIWMPSGVALCHSWVSHTVVK